jgi:TonB family protein
MRLARLLLAFLGITAALPGEKPALVNKPPRLIKRVEPEYTEHARAAGIQGTVMLRAQLDEKGQLSAFSISRGLGYGLDENAIRCAQQWKFEPSTRNGVPIAVHIVLEVNFRLPPPPRR